MKNLCSRYKKGKNWDRVGWGGEGWGGSELDLVRLITFLFHGCMASRKGEGRRISNCPVRYLPATREPKGCVSLLYKYEILRFRLWKVCTYCHSRIIDITAGDHSSLYNPSVAGYCVSLLTVQGLLPWQWFFAVTYNLQACTPMSTSCGDFVVLRYRETATSSPISFIIFSLWLDYLSVYTSSSLNALSQGAMVSTVE